MVLFKLTATAYPAGEMCCIAAQRFLQLPGKVLHLDHFKLFPIVELSLARMQTYKQTQEKGAVWCAEVSTITR